MDDAFRYPVVVLKVKKMCCKSYLKKMKKELLKLDGVISISVDAERSLVSVRGGADSHLVQSTIEKTGKRAKIVRFQQSSNSARGYEELKPDRDVHYQFPHNDGNRAQYHTNSRNNGPVIEEEDDEHKYEAYQPLQIDERICRDFWCKEHNQRLVFHDNAPASANSGFFGHSLRNSGAPPHFSHNNPFPPYGLPGYHRLPLGAAYGYHPGRQLPESGFFGYGHYR